MCFVSLKEDDAMPIRTTRFKQSSRSSQQVARAHRHSTMEEVRRVETPRRAPSPSVHTRVTDRHSRAPSRPRSTTRSAYVEVDRDSSVGSSSDGNSRKPYSEYSMHEREYRRAVSRPSNDYETYRYVDSPRSRYNEDYRRSRDDNRRVVNDDLHISMTRERR